MAINQISTANTFQHWLIATQQLIAFANTLTDGGANSEFIVNTNMTVLGTVNTKDVLTQTLNVTNQASINALTSNTITTNTFVSNVINTITFTTNTARINVITFGDNTTLNSNSFISTLNNSIVSVNTYLNGPILTRIDAAFLHANSSYDFANTLSASVSSGSSRLNSAFAHANGAFAKANSAANINAVNNITSTTLYPVMVGVAGSDAVPNVTTTKLTFNASAGALNVAGFYTTTGSNAGYRYADRGGGTASRYSSYSSGNIFYIRDDLTSADRITLDSNGDVCVPNKLAAGKTSAQATLDWRDTVSVHSSGTVSAVASRTYFLTGIVVLNLPASPTVGDWVKICNRGTTLTSTVGRNGSNIMGLAENMTVDVANVPFTLVYSDSTNGWVIT